MPERKGYIIENTYQGGPSAFQPTPLASGLYPISSGTLALAQDPRTANVLQAVSDRIASGVKNVEVVMLKEISDAMPKQHLDELNRMSKLTGVDMSIHGPVIDVTGLSQQGFSEAEREMAERKVLQTLQRSHQVDPDSNINVTFHSAEGIPGSQPLAPHKRFEVESRIEPGEKVEIKSKKIIAVDQETGQMAVLDEDTKYYPGGPVKKEILYPEEMLDVHNHSAWDNMLTKIEFNRENIDRIMHDVHTRDRDKFLHNIELQSREEKPEPLTVEEYAQQKKIYSASSYAKEAELAAKSAFDRAYKYGTQEDRDFLDKLSKQYGEMLGMTEKGQRTLVSLDPIIRADALQGLIKGLENLQPKLSVPVDEFALKQSAKTFGNAAFESYKEFKDKSPTLVIENPPAGFGLSTGEDIANIVKESRRQFIEQAEKSCEDAGSYAWLIISKRNGRTPIVTLPYYLYKQIKCHFINHAKITFNDRDAQSVFIMTLDEFLDV
ncbi:MAG: hypothetical protein KKE05_00065, partial [Nanoarchaeota archaeon]|nr:hypothetical protein [Nanoarchaeota archaeon]